MNSPPRATPVQSTSGAAPAPVCLTSADDTTRWFKEEVLPHEGALRKYLRRRFPSVDADDVVQESYLKLFRVRAQGTIASAKTYIFAIARNSALAVFRRRKFFSDIPVNELPHWHMLDDHRDGATLINAREQFTLAEDAINHLPARCREIIQLAAFEQLSPAEIASRLGIAESTVYVQLARGVKKCADFLRERGELP